MLTEITNDFRIVFFDIESAPNISYTWGMYDQNVIHFIEQWHMLSFSYKVSGDKTPVTYTLPDFDLYQTEPNNDRELVKKLWEVLDSADLVIGHNSDSFDLKKAAARFIYHGLPPPSPYKSVDTLKLARKLFAFNSNKLTDLCQYLGIGKKVKTGGFDLWLGCMSGDLKSWKTMAKYNAHDVALLELLYQKFRGWAPTHPDITINKKTSDVLCPTCGGNKVQKRGHRKTKMYQARLYQCQNEKCFHWFTGPREKRVDEPAV